MFFKKILIVIISTLLILGNVILPKSVVNAESDTTPPVLKSVSVDKKTVNGGESVTVKIKATDDISGVKYVQIFYKSPSEATSKGNFLYLNENGEYTGKIGIDKNDEEGQWKVDFIALTDNVSNTVYIRNSEINDYGTLKDLSKGDFQVKGTISDTTPPVLKSLSVDKKTVNGGENVTVKIKATDDISGVKYVQIFYKSPSEATSKGNFLYLSENGEYTGNIGIDKNDEEGQWKVDFIALTDNVSNTVYIRNSEINDYGTLKDLSKGDFQVKGTISDTTPPVLKSLSVDKKTVNGGENVTVKIKATDDISGVKYVQIFYKSPSGATSKGNFLYLNENGEYTGNIGIDKNDEEGQWKVDFIALTDNVGNTVYIYNSEINDYGTLKDLSAGDFKVGNTLIKVKGITLNENKLNLNIGQESNLTATINPSNAADKTVTWASDNASVVKVDSNGKITAVSAGSTNVIVKTKDGNYSAGCTVTVVKPMPSIKPLSQKYITGSEYWTSNTINGDLYIGPQAVLTINGSVTVKGNIYVLGAIKNYGNLNVTGGIHAKSFNWGNSTLYNGTVLMLGGTNSISSIIASNSTIDIPFKVYEAKDNTLLAFDNKINITGATLPIIDLYADKDKINYNKDGTFSLALNTKNKTSINFKLTDVYGNSKTMKYKIINKYFDTNSDRNIDIKDIAAVAKNYNIKSNADINKGVYDYNNDGIVDIYDLVLISKNIG